MSKNLKLNEKEYNGVSLVTIPTTDGGTSTFKDVDEIITPSGQLSITENGAYNIEDYASVSVNVQSESSGGLNIDNVVMGLEPNGDIVLNEATVITPYRFMNNYNLVTVNAPKVQTVDNSAFQCSAIDTKLESLNLPLCESLGNYSLAFRQGLTSLVLPKVTSIGNGTFNMCKELKTIKFGSKLTSVGTNLFSGCTQNMDIYVPCAEGEITWTTLPTTFTVHYNTVYDENWNVVS